MRMLTIGNLARRTGVRTDTIRFYEKLRLITAADQTGSGYRLYPETAIRRVSFVKNAQRCGFSLAEIGALLCADSPQARAATSSLAARKKRELDETSKVLELMSMALASYIDGAGSGRAADWWSDEHPLVVAFTARLDAARTAQQGPSKEAARLDGSRRAV